MQKQTVGYIANILSPCLPDYRRSLSTPQELPALFENCKNVFDYEGFGGAVLMDLSKVFDKINLHLLSGELHAYIFLWKSTGASDTKQCNN